VIIVATLPGLNLEASAAERAVNVGRILIRQTDDTRPMTPDR